MKKTFKSSSLCNISTSMMVLFEIHQRFKGHFLNELRVSFKTSSGERYTPFLSISLLNLGKCRLRLTEIKLQASKNYKTCKHRYKLCHINQTVKVQLEKKPVSNLKSIRTVGFEQTSAKFIDIFVPSE